MKKISEEILHDNLEQFEMYLYERENAEATIRKYMADVRTFFTFLGKNRTVDKKRLLSYKEWLLKRVRMQKCLFLCEEKELTRKEYEKLLKTAISEGKYQLALCMETIVSTGIRISELVYFTVEAVYKNCIEIVNKGKYRRIFIPKSLRKMLLKYAEKRHIGSGPIFVTKNGKPKNRSNIWREMKSLKEKAGIEGKKIFPHNLRHLFARIYYEVTKDLRGLGDILGHSSLNVTRIYTSNTGKIYQKQLDNINYIRKKNTT